jgi:SHS2 domain-containing protein
MPYEVFEHTADLGLAVRAAGLTDLFNEAARGLFSMIVANPGDVRPVVEKAFRLEGDEHDLLLFDWLNELLFTFETEQLLLTEFDVSVEESHAAGLVLTARCRGEPVDHERHRLEHEIKAITYHGLSVERIDDEWVAEVIVDI